MSSFAVCRDLSCNRRTTGRYAFSPPFISVGFVRGTSTSYPPTAESILAIKSTGYDHTLRVGTGNPETMNPFTAYGGYGPGTLNTPNLLPLSEVETHNQPVSGV